VKHPVLVRVFAIVLAIMCVISGAAGAVGFSDARKERDDGVSYGDKLDKRLENYQQLKEELDGSISYDEAMEELEKLQEQHDSDASQHRTDLATYSASRGGYKMGADALWEAKAQIEGAKQMIAQAKPMVEKMESAKAALQGAIGQCDAAAGECSACIATINAVLDVIAQKPVGPKKPEAPQEPTKVPECEEPQEVENPGEAPVMPEKQEGQTDEEYQQLCEQAQKEFDEKKSAYEKYLQDLADYKAYVDYRDNIKPKYDEEYEAYLQAEKEYPEKLDAYETELDEWVEKVNAAAAQVNSEEFKQQSEKAMADAAAALQTVAAMKDMMPSAAAFSADGGTGAADPGAGSDPAAQIEQLKRQLTLNRAKLLAMAGMLNTASSGLNQAVNEMDSQFMSAIGQMGGSSGIDLPKGLSPSELIAYAEEQISKGEFEIQKNLENIWYELGELEKDKEELQEDKGQLDEEASKLGRMIVSTDELQELNKKFKSARAVLTNIGEVKTAVDAGESIEDASAGYIAQYRAETQTRFDTRCAICILAVAAGIMGLAVIPAAFEKTKKRVWLILPAVLCLLCAAAAETTCAAANLGQHYASIFTAVFAALYLLVALPKNKTGAAE